MTAYQVWANYPFNDIGLLIGVWAVAICAIVLVSVGHNRDFDE